MNRIVLIDDDKEHLKKFSEALGKYSGLVEVTCFTNGVDALDFLTRSDDSDIRLIVVDQQFLVKRADQPNGIEPCKLYCSDENGQIELYPEDTDPEYVAAGQSADIEQGFLIIQKLQQHYAEKSGFQMPHIVMCTINPESAGRTSTLRAEHVSKSDLFEPEKIIRFAERFLGVSLKTEDQVLRERDVPENCLKLLASKKPSYKRQWLPFVDQVIAKARARANSVMLTYLDVVTAMDIVKSEFPVEILDPDEYWRLLRGRISCLSNCELQDYHEDCWFYAFYYTDQSGAKRTLFLLRPGITDQSVGGTGTITVCPLQVSDPYIGSDVLVFEIVNQDLRGWVSLRYHLERRCQYLLSSEHDSIKSSWEKSYPRAPLPPLELILTLKKPVDPHFIDKLDQYVTAAVKGSSVEIGKYVVDGTGRGSVLPHFRKYPGTGVENSQEVKFFEKLKQFQTEHQAFWIIAGGSFVFPTYPDRHHELDAVIIYRNGIHICECKQSPLAKASKPEQLKNQLNAFQDFLGVLTPSSFTKPPLKASYILPEGMATAGEDMTIDALLSELERGAAFEEGLNEETIIRLGVNLERSFAPYEPTRPGTVICGSTIERGLGLRKGVYEYLGSKSGRNVLIRECRVKERYENEDHYSSLLSSLRSKYSYVTRLPTGAVGLLRPTEIIALFEGVEVPLGTSRLDYIYEVFDIGIATDVGRLGGKTDWKLVERLRIMRDLVAGLATLHGLDLAHGDISKENVLIIQTADGPNAVFDWLYKVKSSSGYADRLQDRTKLRSLLIGLPCAQESDESKSDVFIERLISLVEVALVGMGDQASLNNCAQTLDGIYKTYVAYKNQHRADKPVVVRGVNSLRGVESSGHKKLDVKATAGSWLGTVSKDHPVDSSVTGTISEVYPNAIYFISQSGHRCYYEGTSNVDLRHMIKVGDQVSAKVIKHDHGGKKIRVDRPTTC